MSLILDELRGGTLARWVYLAAAHGTARMLAWSGTLRTVLARRSVGTGEIYFGRSDIDLALILKAGSSNGAGLEKLYRWCRFLRRLNPALGHCYVFQPPDIEKRASFDTMWQAMESRSLRHLWGLPFHLEACPVEPLDAIREFLLWFDFYLPAAVQRLDNRNCRKHALECWNMYAVAQKLLDQPFVTRARMQEHLSRCREVPADLHTPEGAVRFILELASELHASRLPALSKLSEPLVFRGSTPPHGARRTYVVLPAPDSPLPDEAYHPGSFIATPEVLDLYVQYKNGFLSWCLPAELGIEPPTVVGFLKDLRYYCSPHFLCFPGFMESGEVALDPAEKFVYLDYAFDWLSKGKLPPPMTALAPQTFLTDVSRYYLETYDLLRGRTEELMAALNRSLGD